jgi:ketosteroid isomerase-like protein
MSEENVEIVRRAIDAWNRRDIEDLLALGDPEGNTSTPRRLSSRARGVAGTRLPR